MPSSPRRAAAACLPARLSALEERRLSPNERSQKQSRGAASDHQIGASANHRLTATTGLVLVPLLGLVFLTGLAMDAYWHVHYVIGFVLIPVIAVRRATPGYGAARYYTGAAPSRARGPPQIGLRLLAPLLVVAITVALVTGVALFAAHSRTGTLSTLHTDSAVISAGLVGIHFLAYLSDAVRTTLSELRRRAPRGRCLRWILVL